MVDFILPLLLFFFHVSWIFVDTLPYSLQFLSMIALIHALAFLRLSTNGAYSLPALLVAPG